MLDLKLIIGSTRPGRAADHIIPWFTEKANHHPAFEVEVLDLRNWELPMFAETFATVGDLANPMFSSPNVKEWNTKIAEGDAYVFITPEYNHSVPAVLKNAIDSVFATFAFRNKPFGCVAYSGSIAGGSRAVEHLAHIGVEAEMVPLRNNLIIPCVTDAFDADARPKHPRAEMAATILLDDLAWWATQLRVARSTGELLPAFMRQMAAHSGG
jgi:NAD(P)H-dependent FMN reductase